MTFSQDVKRELAQMKPEKPCCMLSELSALTQSCASLLLHGGGRFLVRYSVENTAAAKLIFLLLKNRLSILPAVQYRQNPRFGGRRIFTLTVKEQDSRRLLIALNMLKTSETGDVFRGVPRGVLLRRCCRQAFLRGAFLGAGAMSSPYKGYHLEFICASSERAQIIGDILFKSGIQSSQLERRGAAVVYVKTGEKIADILALMGASKAVMDLQNIRITKESRGQANRALNCDAANVKKQLQAAERQAESIKAYSLEHSLSALSQPLQEIARLRMLNPDASLEQLGALLEPPIQKSGVNHRLRRLMEIIQQSKEGK